jgi:hypothetical protein
LRGSRVLIRYPAPAISQSPIVAVEVSTHFGKMRISGMPYASRGARALGSYEGGSASPLTCMAIMAA